VCDRFFLCDNKILCEYDYEERMVFANLAYNSNSLAQIKQQARTVSGGGPGPNGPPQGVNGVMQQQHKVQHAHMYKIVQDMNNVDKAFHLQIHMHLIILKGLYYITMHSVYVQLRSY